MVQLTPGGQQHFIPLQYVVLLGDVQMDPEPPPIGLSLHLYLVVPQAVQLSNIPLVQLTKL